MNPPVLLAIVLNLQASLQGISRTSGYFYDLKATSVVLDPEGLDAKPASELPVIVLGHRIESMSPRLFTSRPVSIKVQRRIVLEAILDATGADTSRKLTAIERLVADVETALAVDITCGGLAMDTRVQDETPYVSGLPNQHRCYVEIPVEVTFGRKYGQPSFVDPPEPTPIPAYARGFGFAFGGSSLVLTRPASSDAYPSGSTVDRLVPNSVVLTIDSALLPGTYALEATARVEGATARAKVALFNLTDAPNTPMAGSELVFPTGQETGALIRGGAITFPAAGVVKQYGVKLTTDDPTLGAAVWGARLVRTV